MIPWVPQEEGLHCPTQALSFCWHLQGLNILTAMILYHKQILLFFSQLTFGHPNKRGYNTSAHIFGTAFITDVATHTLHTCKHSLNQAVKKEADI